MHSDKNIVRPLSLMKQCVLLYLVNILTLTSLSATIFVLLVDKITDIRNELVFKVSRFANISHFHPLKVVGRGSKKQL